jgi:acetate---CoA ligase (ADP-forming)
MHRTVVAMALTKLLRPASIAVVGASPRSFIGQVALRNCQALGFAGALTPVSPRHAEVAGMRSVAALSELPAAPDVAVVQVHADRVLPIVEAGVRAGTRGFVIPGAGYSDSGQAALELVKGLVALREQHEFDVVGPNCMGVLDLGSGAAPYVGSVTPQVRRGTVGVLAQSGAIVEAFVGSGGRVAISTAISSGSEAITTSADYLTFFADDDETTAVLAFIETLVDAEATMAAVRRCSMAGKPVAVCVVGHSDAGSAGVQAHSGKLATGARVTAAAFRQAGAVIAADLDELMAFGELFSARRTLPSGKRTHVVTNSGGEANLIADIDEATGLELPPISDAMRSGLNRRWPRLGVRNPLDPWGADDYTHIYPEAIARAAAEPGDIVVVAMDQHRASGEHERRLGRDLARYLHDVDPTHTKLPVLLSPISEEVDPELVDFCRQAQIPLLRGARPALSVLAKTADRIAVGSPGTDTGPVTDGVGTGFRGRPPSEDEALETLAAIGVPTPRRIRVDTPDRAAAAAEQLGTAVVLKGVAPGVTHKTERGLVDVAPRDVAASARQMQRRNPDLTLSFLVVEQVRGQLEVIVGYKRDQVFGPTVVVGLGGVWTEFLDTAAVHVGALDPQSAHRLLDATPVGRMIRDARGGALCRSAVVSALLAVSALGSGCPDILSIDVNPLIVGRDHATAVDAVIELAQQFPTEGEEK